MITIKDCNNRPEWKYPDNSIIEFVTAHGTFEIRVSQGEGIVVRVTEGILNVQPRRSTEVIILQR